MKQEIQNEIIFISNAYGNQGRSKKLITYDITVDTASGEDVGVTLVSFVSDPPSKKPFVIIHDAELTASLKRWNDHKDNKAAWERTFHCPGCNNRGRENFTYLNSFPGGESHLCDNCAATICTSHEPTRKP